MGQLTATKWQMTAQRSNIAGIYVCVTAPNLVETRSLQRVISRLQVGVASSALFERRTTMSGIFFASTRAQGRANGVAGIMESATPIARM